MIATTLEGIVTYWNRGAERQLGYSSSEILGRQVYDLYPETRRSVTPQEFSDLLRKHGSLEFDAKMRKKSGEEIIVHSALSPIVDAGGQITGVISYTLDVTSQRRAETLLREREKIEKELEIAKKIQQSLLPSVAPRIRGFEVAGWNLSADHTGGDYFDWLELPDGRLTFSLGDVTGHGVGAALIVAVCRAYFRASSSWTDDLGSMMQRTNALVSHDLIEGRFITLTFGILHPEKGLMHLYSAGHAPNFFYQKQDGRILRWGADDVPLGVVESFTLNPPRTVRFNSGDMLVLVTDGFLEWADSKGERFGAERLESVIAAHHADPIDETIQAMYTAVLQFSGGTPQADDLTALVIRKT